MLRHQSATESTQHRTNCSFLTAPYPFFHSALTLNLSYEKSQWIKEVHSAFPTSDHIPILAIGLKRDLRSEDDPNGAIYPQEAYKISQQVRADKYVECSAVTGELLKLAFEEICATAAQTKTEAGGQSEGGCVAM